jgi:hypothetical protein
MPNGWVLIAAAAAVIVGLSLLRRLLGLIVLAAVVAVFVIMPGPRDAVGTAWDQGGWSARGRCLGAALSTWQVWTGHTDPARLPECHSG